MAQPIAYDAVMLTLAALTRVCASDPKSGRRRRRRAIREMQAMPVMPSVRLEAIRGLQRSCGVCRACKGV